MLGFLPISSSALSDIQEISPTVVTGVEANGAAGSVLVNAVSNVPSTGLVATSEVGVVAVDAKAVANTAGLEASTAVGTVDITAIAFVYPVGIEATSVVGTITAAAEANIYPTGLEATASVDANLVTTDAEANIYPAGIEASTAVGAVHIVGEANLTLDGLQGDLQLGEIVVKANALILAVGSQAVTSVGQVRMWSQIAPIVPLDPWTPLDGVLAAQSFNSQVTPNVPFADVWQLVDLVGDDGYTDPYTDEVIAGDAALGGFEDLSEVA